MKIINYIKRKYYTFVYQLDKALETTDKGACCYWNWVTNYKNDYIGFYLCGKSRFSKKRIQFIFDLDKPYHNRDYAIVARLLSFWNWNSVKIYKQLYYDEYIKLGKKGKLPNSKKYFCAISLKTKGKKNEQNNK